ncbi:MAG: DUF1592 domain-containing protein [Pirellulales bacterium]
MKQGTQFFFAAALVMAGARAQAAGPVASVPATHGSFFKANCLKCHSADKAEANVRLDDLPSEIKTLEAAERWQKVLAVLNSGEMPPADEPRPDAKAKADLLSDLSQAMVVARKAIGDEGRVATLRRLNRREYKNTLKDLFGLDLDVAALPDDKGGAEFDTIGSSLFMSSDQFEQYLAVGRRAAAAIIDRWRLSMNPDQKPVTVRTEVEIMARRAQAGPIYGFLIHGYKQAKRWQTAGADPARAKEFGLPDEHEAAFRLGQVEKKGSLQIVEWYTKKFADQGVWIGPGVYPTLTVDIPPKSPNGDYVIRVAVGYDPESLPERRFLEVGIQEGQDFRRLHVFEVTRNIHQPQVIEVPMSVMDQGPRNLAFRERRFDNPLSEERRNNVAKAINGVGIESALWIDWSEVEGPIVPLTAADRWRRLFGTTALDTTEPAQAKAMLEHFATVAFRGVKPKPAYVEKLAALHAAHLSAGKSPADALVEPLAVVLASPAFLYLNEPVAAGSAATIADRQLSDLELASRLSYFLWSAPPDDELLSLAAAGGLRKPGELAKQTARMLADPRSFALAADFSHQWLDVDRLDFFRFDWEMHPDFDESVQRAAKQEIYHTVHTLLKENLDARRLLKNDFVVVDGLLANYYGLQDLTDPVKPKPITGDQFRKVSLPPDSPRGGLLGMAAVLGMGSNGERTSPVERGAWVLRKLLNDPPPPAPANVPQLARLDGQVLGTRERLRTHQEEPQCAQCHRRIDPIGFGLENFSAGGKWRTEEPVYAKGLGTIRKSDLVHVLGKVVEKTFPIDPAGAFYEGPAFKDYFELRDRVAERGDGFLRGLVEHLYAYALGRPVSFADAEAIDGLVVAAKTKQGGLADIVQLLVATPEFQTK